MSTRELSSPPNTLLLYGRAALPLVPFASRLPFVGGGGKTLPDRELVLRDVRADADKLRAYREICGFLQDDRLPATYPFVLGFPLSMALMTAGDFPFPAVGLVHLRNRIVQRRPIAPDEALTLRVRAQDLKPHPKGQTFDTVTTATVGDEEVWSCVATTFRRGKGSGESADKGTDPIDVIDVEPNVTWEVPDDIGRRYAAISGDVNPIHLHPLSAKALGFPRAIAHGMWTKAKSLAGVEDLLPDAYAVDVRFQKPVLLPATVEWGAEKADDGRIGFALRDKAKGVPHLRGLVTPS
ncbi:MaoC/PaaZ C-terminal domain-containing protein [Patulibacter sp. SYSU D01012]|uniref:MaoC family dehydratase n=1 Tax=Patulibacter sp. SYSU D01012 TaxID=2817381 RepID=UPI001B30328D|nr:MaoC/PaaZ C-terminal domain-containing protein [Patulibacter sp. SYSU D01012]